MYTVVIKLYIHIMTREINMTNLERAIFKEKTDRTSLDDESIPSNLANASKVDASEGTSKLREL